LRIVMRDGISRAVTLRRHHVRIAQYVHVLAPGMIASPDDASQCSKRTKDGAADMLAGVGNLDATLDRRIFRGVFTRARRRARNDAHVGAISLEERRDPVRRRQRLMRLLLAHEYDDRELVAEPARRLLPTAATADDAG